MPALRQLKPTLTTASFIELLAISFGAVAQIAAKSAGTLKIQPVSTRCRQS